MLEWHRVESKMEWQDKRGRTEQVDFWVWRSKVPGGWFVCVGGQSEFQAFFYPDPEHTWDGSSVSGW